MILGQLASSAALFLKFHAGIRKSLSDFWPSLLEQQIKFGFISIFRIMNLLGLVRKNCLQLENDKSIFGNPSLLICSE